ncbi:hypothetical protein EJD97_000707 [Solanum chilense]|uniref:Uncharacterized protein n=1 Tax=Solanum chilense TaxID=4083 RepID=A0A6N2ANA9_SOLCI|nr:hypothetical protein EJD97_000707 [Solanum chilense]
MNAAKNSKEKGNGRSLEQEKDAREETTKPPNQPNKNQKEGMKNSEEQNQSKEQGIDLQHKQDRHKQEEQGQQEEHQGDQWQTQKKRNHKNQDSVNSKSVWRPVTAPLQHTNNNQQQEQGITGNNIIPIQNNFSYLEMQEKQDTQHTEQQGFRKKANQEDHNTDEQWTDQPADNKQNKLQTPNKQAAEDNKCKKSGIDLSLPNPRTPNDFNAIDGHTDEVYGGMDGGCKEKTTNLQDGVTKGGNLPHAMHEGLDYDHRSDHRASRSDENVMKQQYQQSEQYEQNTEIREQSAKAKQGKQQHRNKEADEQRKQGDTKDIGNTPKSKNKPSKQKRDAEKRRQNRQQEKNSEQGEEGKEESCKKFVMIDDNQGLDITPLQIQYMIPHNPNKNENKQQEEKDFEHVLDDYAVINSEDEIGSDSQSLQEDEDNDETSEALIRAFSPYKDHSLEDEIKQVTKTQSLSPRSFQQNRFHFTKQDVNTVTAGRPNTRLFSSKSSQ